MIHAVFYKKYGEKRMIDYILSRDVKKFMEEHQITLTDSQIATLIWHSPNSLTDKYESLKELSMATSDETLKQQICDRFEAYKKIWEVVTENDGSCIYSLEVYEEDEKEYDIIGYFSSFEIAVAAAEHLETGYWIQKNKVFRNVEDLEALRTDEHILPVLVGSCSFTKEGTVTNIWSDEFTAEIEEIVEERFEEQYVYFEHPFQKGDIVKNLVTGDLGVVAFITNGFMVKKLLEEGLHLDSSDMTINVEFWDDRGYFSHEHVLPTVLEYCDIEELDELLKNLLRTSSFLMKGEGSIQCYEFEKNRYLASRKK